MADGRLLFFRQPGRRALMGGNQKKTAEIVRMSGLGKKKRT